MKKEVEQIIEANFKTKNLIVCETSIFGAFNGCHIRIEAVSIIVE